MSLLREIQKDATDQQISLATLLRKAKVLAFRLRHEELARWVDQELAGYAEASSLPSYRVLTYVESRGNLLGLGGLLNTNTPIPTAGLPSHHADQLSTQRLTQSVAELEALAKGNELSSPWPADVVAVYSEKFFEGWQLTDAWKVIPAGQIIGLLDSIRSKILTFALEIERANPIAGEAEPNSTPVPPAQVQNIFHTAIMGGQNTIAQGGQVAVKIDSQVVTGDVESLKRFLGEAGVPAEEVKALGEIVEAEATVTTDAAGKKGLGPRVREWLGKAASGAFEVGKEVTADVLGKALLKFYGLG